MQDKIRVMAYDTKIIATRKPITSYNVLFKFPMTDHQLEDFIDDMPTRRVLGNAFVLPGKLTFGCDRENFYILGGPADNVENAPVSAKYYRYREVYPNGTLIDLSVDSAVLNEIGGMIKKFNENPFGCMSGPDNHTAVEIAYSDGSVLRMFMSDWSVYVCADFRKGDCTY